MLTHTHTHYYRHILCLKFPLLPSSQSDMPFVSDIQKKHFFDLKKTRPWKFLSRITEKQSNLSFLVSESAVEALLCEVQIELSELNWMSWSIVIDRGTPTHIAVVVASTNMTGEDAFIVTLMLYLSFSLPSLCALHLHLCILCSPPS